jgi:xanthine dehydrogenase accessory factor
MIPAELSRRADELAARREAYVTATVVRIEHPTSARPGNVALIHEDGTIEGFVGGVCAEHSVRVHSLKVIESGEPVLLRILPDGPPATGDLELDAGRQIDSQEGAVTVQNPCLSGGSIEVFLEPFLPAPRVVVAGDSPIAAALSRLAPELGLEVVTTTGPDAAGQLPQPGDLGAVVAAHGRAETEILKAALDAGVEYVGLVASQVRGAAILDELRQDGVPDERLQAIDTPAGFDIGASNPGEIAVSILAQIIAVRRQGGERRAARPARVAPRTAVDPICGMTVVVGDDTPSSRRDGEMVYFCCEGCRRSFDAQTVA